jgi:hypothetical protein
MSDTSQRQSAGEPTAPGRPIDQHVGPERAITSAAVQTLLPGWVVTSAGPDVASGSAIGQAEAARDRRAGMRRRHRTVADDLREAWRAAAAAAGPYRYWRAGPDWWTPAVDGVARAIADGRDPSAPLTQLGRERATARIGLAQTLDDVNAFYRLHAGAATPPGLVRAAVAGWRAVADARPRPGPPPCWRGQHLPGSLELCPASCDAMVP